MQDHPLKQTKWTIAIVSALVLSACAPSSDSHETYTPIEPKILVQNDLAAMEQLPSDTLIEYDKSNNGMLTKIFGGAHSSDLRSYFDQRIKYVLTRDDLKEFQSNPTYFNQMLEEDPEEKEKMRRSGAQVAASNLGMGLWFQALISGVDLELYRNGETIRVDSPRVGLMLIGPGYNEWTELPNGRIVKAPSEYRQATLLHEARHSDCSGGLQKRDLQVARGVESVAEFDAKFKGHACGHMHTLCKTEESGFKGLAACDNHPWGAYTISAVFSEASLAHLSGLDRVVMETKVIDQWSRLELKDKDTTSISLGIKSGAMGKPDMSSSGLRED